MSYARLGPDSDVYVYDSGDGLFCQWCQRVDGEHSYSRAEMLEHLEQHVAAGDKVPAEALARLRFELANGDRNMLDKHGRG